MSDDQRRMHDGSQNMPVGEFAEAMDLHPLWQGAMLVTPIEGRAWHPGDRDEFLALCAMICDMLYPQSVLAERRAFGRPMADSQIDRRAEELADEMTAELGAQLALAEEQAERLEREAVDAAQERDAARAALDALEERAAADQQSDADAAGSEESVTTVDISRMSPESQELLRTAAEIAGQPDGAPPADMTIIGREGFAVDARPCKVDDCDNLAVKRGQWAGICEDDREHLEGGGAVLIDGVPMVLNGRTGRGLVEQGGVNG